MAKQHIWQSGSKVDEEDLPAVPTIPVKLGPTSFMDVAIAGVRSANSSTQAQAEARFQEIIESARDKSGTTDTDKRIRYVHERYSKATTFNKAVVDGMLSLFVSASLCSADERTAILAAWPNE